MTREEAIEELKARKEHYEMGDGCEFLVEALDKGIKALEQEPCKDMEEIREVMSCDADAETKCKMISNILTAKPHYFNKQEFCKDVISRQAVNTLVDELARAISDERCCISRGRSTATIMQDILDLPSVISQPCEDAISRDAVLDLVANYDLSMGQVVKGIHALPFVTSQLKTGHWEETDLDIYECSECHIGTSVGTKGNFCPNCGVKMVESQKSEE